MAAIIEKDVDEILGILRTAAVFEGFDERQLRWVVDHSDEIRTEPGEVLYSEGAEWNGMAFLLEGKIEIFRTINGTMVPNVAATQPGAWGGGAPFLDEPLAAGTRTPTASVLLRLSREDSEELVRSFPISHHIVRGLRDGTQRWQERIDGQERLAALGRLSAGLAHELNNPAAAARRAAARLREAVARQRAALVELAHTDPRASMAGDLASVERDIAVTMAAAEPLRAMERSDREDAVAAKLGAKGLGDADPSAFVDAGIDPPWVERFIARFPAEASRPALRWLLAQIEVTQISREIEDATGRISGLVAAIKDYTYMDRGPVVEADVHDGIESTLAMLRYRLRGVNVVRDYDRSIPKLTVHGAELNQVWTNLIDNAADALSGSGTLTLTTRRAGDWAYVVVSDDGPGIPPDALTRIFEPFYTTKDVGKGTGLGLDIAQRIVIGHSGTIQATSQPGDTRFEVRLPVHAA